jgi:hypothetical protein
MPSNDARRRLLQSRTAAAVRHRLPEADDLRRELAVAWVEEYIHAVLRAVPQLHAQDRQRLTAALSVAADACPPRTDTAEDLARS